jgi:hypothetical protein
MKGGVIMSMAVGNAVMPNMMPEAGGEMTGISKVQKPQPQGGGAQGVAQAQTLNDSLKTLNALVKQQKPEPAEKTGKSVNVYA